MEVCGMIGGRVSRSLFVAAWMAVTLLVSCAPGERPSAPSEAQQPRATERQAQVIRVVNREDPTHLTVKPVGGDYVPRMISRMFNAQLTYQDEHQAYHPELAETLPQLGTDSWRVFPDGQMETTYKLKPNLTWHDGTPLTTSDFLFAYQVYTGPELGRSVEPPQNLMQDVTAPDPRTLVIRWRALYPGADSLALGDGAFGDPFPPLPRHILEEPLRRGNVEAFASHPYWSTEYVGLGPFRLDRWERGAFLDAVAFDGYVLGRPKLDRVHIVFHSDGNTIAANFLAGEVDINAEEAVRPELGVTLQKEWEARGSGVVKFFSSMSRRTDIQVSPARANPEGLMDLRVRRALAHGIDKDAVNQVIQAGLGQTADQLVTPEEDHFADADRVITKYPFDLRRAAQLLAEAGYTKGTDGFYVTPSGSRLTMRLDHVEDPAFNQESAIMADTLKQLGIEISINSLSRAQWRDPARGPDFPALRNQGGGEVQTIFGSSQIPTAENRYTGSNRGSWLNAEYDRLQEAFGVTLDRSERRQQLIQMSRLISEEVPAIPLYYRLKVTAHIPQLQGVLLGDRVGAYWNIYQWELR
jgi:peptide/nickel transport system substrate-binding protein